jgi:hypothetical protein
MNEELQIEFTFTNSEFFASNNEVESKFEDSIWERRLKDSQARLFLALDTTNLAFHDDQSEQGSLLLAAKAPWIGTTILFGPKLFDGSFPSASISRVEWFNQVNGPKVDINPDVTD